jgi:hypothetical protein
VSQRNAVTEEDGGWSFACPSCPFTSTGWPTKKEAEGRGREHRDEHESGEPMSALPQEESN